MSHFNQTLAKFGMVPIECDYNNPSCNGGNYIPQGPSGPVHFWIPAELNPYDFIPYNPPLLNDINPGDVIPLAINGKGVITHQTVASVMAAQNKIPTVLGNVSGVSNPINSIMDKVKSNPTPYLIAAGIALFLLTKGGK